MSSSARKPAAQPTAVSVKFGSWFEAHATGWGVPVVAVIALAALAALALSLYLRG